MKLDNIAELNSVQKHFGFTSHPLSQELKEMLSK